MQFDVIKFREEEEARQKKVHRMECHYDCAYAIRLFLHPYVQRAEQGKRNGNDMSRHNNQRGEKKMVTETNKNWVAK